MFPYTAQNPDELTFYKGSVINVVSKEGEWWKGEMNGQTGMFPSNYVQPLSDLKMGTTQCKSGLRPLFELTFFNSSDTFQVLVSDLRGNSKKWS